MHRDVSVPIISLTGVISITDLLPEMPIPVAIRQFYRSSRSLLFHPRLAQRALSLLCEKDETLISQLVHSLIQTSTDHIIVQEKYAETKPLIAYQENVPELLRAVIATNPDVFKVTLITSSDMSQFVDMNQPSTAGVHAYRFNVLQLPTPVSNPVSNNIDTNQAPTPMLCRACAERQRLGLLPTPAQLPVTVSQKLSTTSDKTGPTTMVSNKNGTNTMEQIKQLREMESNIRSMKDNNVEMEYANEENVSNGEHDTRQESHPAQAADVSISAVESHSIQSDRKEEVEKMECAISTESINDDISKQEHARDAPCKVPVLKMESHYIQSEMKVEIIKMEYTDSKTIVESNLPTKNEISPGTSNMKQPSIRLRRISMEDLRLMQLSLRIFAEKRARLAKELGILPLHSKIADVDIIVIDDSDSDTECLKQK